MAIKEKQASSKVVAIANPTDFFRLNLKDALVDFIKKFDMIELPLLNPLSEELPIARLYLSSFNYISTSLAELNTDTTILQGNIVGYDKDEIIRVFEELALESIIEGIKYEDSVDKWMTGIIGDARGNSNEEEFWAVLGALNIAKEELTLNEDSPEYESISSLNVEMSTLVICNVLWDEIYDTASTVAKKVAEELIQVASTVTATEPIADPIDN